MIGTRQGLVASTSSSELGLRQTILPQPADMPASDRPKRNLAKVAPAPAVPTAKPPPAAKAEAARKAPAVKAESKVGSKRKAAAAPEVVLPTAKSERDVKAEQKRSKAPEAAKPVAGLSAAATPTPRPTSSPVAPPAPPPAGAPPFAGAPLRQPPPPAPVQAAEDVLLGHVISRCVGIQHYRNNGQRFNKEALRLLRDPHNPYDRNAIAVHTLTGGSMRQVGHVQAIDARSLAIVADKLPIKMVGQVESGADQVRRASGSGGSGQCVRAAGWRMYRSARFSRLLRTRTPHTRSMPPSGTSPSPSTQMYKFPLRISFYGPAAQQGAVAALLMQGGSVLVPPKPRKQKAPKAPRPTIAQANGAGGSGHAASERAHVPPPLPTAKAVAADDDSDDEIVFGETVTWAQRDAALRAQAVVLE